MKQLVQTLKNGKIQVADVPPPILSGGMILVRNYYSLISPGTEGSTIKIAQKNLIGKAKGRPQQVQQVIDFLKEQGPLQTYKKVMNRLDAYSPLGYSSGGKVIDVALDVKGFAVGDFIACGGVGYATHAEVVAVPRNLCALLPPDADLKLAAFNTLGAIALQGMRQANLNIGETCIVIGLGLIGQLTCLLLRASGIKVLGIDIDPEMVNIARQNCVDLAYNRTEPAVVDKIEKFTQGIGADAVIIAAATKSTDPINFAGHIARKKGKIVIVGDIPTGFEREQYYRKELEVTLSCSYGPGRYDPNYEEKGIDYPIAYVRWTEKRNMEAFQELVHSGKVKIDYLITHVFDLENAPKAYDVILNRKQPYLGILIKFDIEEIKIKEKIDIRSSLPSGKVNIGFIGAGNYAQGFLLPNIPKAKGVVLRGLMDSSGLIAKKVAEKYNFEFCTSEEMEIIENVKINTIFIATRHNSHAQYVINALKSGKNVAVEKPLCLSEAELSEIKENYYEAQEIPRAPILMVGFNRRFSPLTQIIKRHISEGPMAMLYRINAGPISPDSWIQDKDIGGGRIVGEVCHFVDYLTFINGSLPYSVYASAISVPSNQEDTLNINLEFKNGSIGTISYLANGSKSFFKEYIEIYSTGMTGIIKDFKELEIYEKGRIARKKFIKRDKGQKNMINSFLSSITEGKESPISFEELYAVTLITFKVMESIRANKRILIS